MDAFCNYSEQMNTEAAYMEHFDTPSHFFIHFITTFYFLFFFIYFFIFFFILDKMRSVDQTVVIVFRDVI